MDHLRVLVVEDSDDDYALLVRELQRGGYSVSALRVDDPEAFRGALGQESWDIVFADYTMPNFNAVAALEIAREAIPDIPFIIVSGTIGEDVAVSAMKSGAHDYFMKGNLARLIPAVQRELHEAAVRQARRQSEESRRRLSAVLDATTDLVAIADPQGRALYLNEAGRRLLGIGPAEDIDQFSIVQAFSERFRPLILKEAIPATLCNDIWRGETAILSWDGREIPVSQVIIAHRAQDRTLEFLATIARDISDLKRSEEALRQANLQLQESLEGLRRMQEHMIQQERLNALRQLSGAIIHDMSNLLTPITGYTDLLLARPELLADTERVRLYLEAVSKAGRDAADIIQRLHLFYHPEGQGTEVTLLDLNQVVRDAVSLTQPRWGAQAQASSVTITVQTDLDELPAVEGREVEFREMLTNLLFNSIDALPDGGTITLRTRHEGDSVVLQVMDTGTGMADDVLQRCTEPFFTSKGERGTGLGLAIVHGTVSKYGGGIDLESRPGQGTTVTIRFPARETRVGGTPQKTPLAGPVRILLVDDDIVVLEVVQECLNADGHSVDTACSGREALEKLPSGDYDLLITDLAMPEMDGIRLADAAKELDPQLSVLLITGFAGQLTAPWEKPGSVDLILNKPIDIAQVRRAVVWAVEGDSM